MGFHDDLSLAELQDAIRRKREQACHLKGRLNACKVPDLRYALRREISNTMVELNYVLCLYAQKSGVVGERMPCDEQTGSHGEPVQSA